MKPDESFFLHVPADLIPSSALCRMSACMKLLYVIPLPPTAKAETHNARLFPRQQGTRACAIDDHGANLIFKQLQKTT